MKWLASLLCCVLAAAGQPVMAQGPSVSYSVWSLSGDIVILRYLLPEVDAQRLVGRDIALVTTGKLEDYLLDHVAVSAGGQDCPAIDQGYDIGRVDPLSVGAGLYGFEIFFQCAHPTGLLLHNTALFDRLPGHINFARIQINGHSSQQLFTASHEQLRVPDSGALPAAGVGRYLAPGARHILGSFDRWCFLFGALLLMRRGWQIRDVVLGLALGYAASLAVSLGGGMTPRLPLLEACIGFVVALLAAQWLARQFARPRLAALGAAGLLLWLAAAVLIAHGTWSVMLLSGAALFAGSFLAVADQLEQHALGGLLLPAVFGFVDGFVLPAALTPMQLPARTLLPMLTGFDLGALLIDALLLLLLLAGTIALLRWQKLASTRALATDIVVAGLGGLGLFWLLSRLYG